MLPGAEMRFTLPGFGGALIQLQNIPASSALVPMPYTLNPEPELETRNPQSLTLNAIPEVYTLQQVNPKPKLYTPKPQLYTLKQVKSSPAGAVRDLLWMRASAFVNVVFAKTLPAHQVPHPRLMMTHMLIGSDTTHTDRNWSCTGHGQVACASSPVLRRLLTLTLSLHRQAVRVTITALVGITLPASGTLRNNPVSPQTLNPIP